MPRPSPDKKEAAMKLIRAGGTSIAAISRETGITEMTLAEWKRKDHQGGEGAPKEPSLKEQNQLLSNALRLLQLTNKYLRLYAKADETEQKDVEVRYLLARLRVFGDDEAKRLSEVIEEEDRDTDDAED